MAYTPHPIRFNTDLSNKIADLKLVCLEIGPDWEFDKTDPETGIHYFAIGYGLGIADWKKYWKSGQFIDTSSRASSLASDVYPLCISCNKVKSSGKHISKYSLYVKRYTDSMFTTAKIVAELTRDDTEESFYAQSPEDKAKKKDARQSLKRSILEAPFSPTPKTLIDQVRTELEKSNSKYMSKVYRDTMRRCGGSFIKPNLMLPHFHNKKIFIFLRDLTPKETDLLERWHARSSKNQWLIHPVKDLSNYKENFLAIEAIVNFVSTFKPSPQEAHS